MVIGTVPDLETPIVPIRAFLITFRDHVAGLGEPIVPACLKAGIRIPFRVFDEATRGPDGEVVQRRLGPMRGCGMRPLEGCPERGAPPSSSHRLRSSRWPGRFGALLMLDIERRRAGFLMTVKGSNDLSRREALADSSAPKRQLLSGIFKLTTAISLPLRTAYTSMR